MRWLSNLAGTLLSALGIGPSGARATFDAGALSADRTLDLPDAAGTIALQPGTTAGRVVITGAGGVLAEDADFAYDGSTNTLLLGESDGVIEVLSPDAGSRASITKAVPNAAGGDTYITFEATAGATSYSFTLGSDGEFSYESNAIWHAGNLLNIGTSAGSARTALALGTMATQNANAVAITGGTVKATGDVTSSGTISALAANSISQYFVSGAGRLTAFGADASTIGVLSFGVLSSDASLGGTIATVSSTGLAVAGAVTHDTPAAADNSTKSATTAFVKSERKFEYVGQATVAGAAATTLTISGLDLDADETYYVEVVLDNATGSSTTLSLYYNADTTATNYYCQFLTATSTSIAAVRNNSAAVFSISAGDDAVSEIFIRRDNSNNTRASLRNSRDDAANVVQQHVAHVWPSGANVTGITLSASVASSLAIGSYIRVYRIKP